MDCAFLAETWFSDSIRDAELSQRGRFNVYRRDRQSRGGGVCILTRKSLVTLEVGCDHPGEFIAVDLLGDDQRLRVACFYLTNSGDACARALRTVECVSAITKLCSVDWPAVIVGDFNLPSINWSHVEQLSISSKEMTFVDGCDSNGLVQLVNFPTHSSGNTLDLLLVSNPELVDRLFHADPSVPSDHHVIGFDLIYNTTPYFPPRTPLNFRKMNCIAIAEYLDAVNWRSLFSSCRNVNDMYLEFVDCCT